MEMKVQTNNGGTLNMRASADTSAHILMKIPNNTKVTVISQEDKWTKIKYNQKEGYVMTSYLVPNVNEITKDDLRTIYNSLKSTLAVIEKILK